MKTPQLTVSMDSVNYPKCDSDNVDVREGELCRFIASESSGQVLATHSPIEYNRKGEPVGGGANMVKTLLHCTVCKRVWTCSQSQLARATGWPVVWEIDKRSIRV